MYKLSVRYLTIADADFILFNYCKMKIDSDASPGDHWKNFIKKYPVHTYSKGEIIIMEGEVPSCARIVKTGLVKTYNINKHGEERPVSFDSVSEMFPIGWVLNLLEHTEYFYEAFTDCEIYEIPKSDILYYFKNNPKMGGELYLTLASRFNSLQSRIYALQQSRASEKIMLTLLYLSERFASPHNRKHKLQKINIPLTQQELANFIGITRETTSTELKKLESIKAIKHKNQEYEINIDKLNQLLEED